MPSIPPRLHFPSPYETPTVLPTAAERIAMDDGALIATFVYGTPGPIGSLPAPILMLHGNGEDHTIFGPTIDAAVASGHAVVAIDSRAQGKSSRGKLPLTYELLASDALTILDTLGVPAAHVLGFSDGAIEGLLLARDHGERVLSLMSIGANLTPESVIEDEEWDIDNSIAANRNWYSYWTTHPTTGVDPDLLTPSPQEASITAELLQLMLDEPHIPAESLSTIACPTTIMVGEFDCIVPEETQAIHSSIAGSRLIVVPEASHSLPKQVPDLVTEELLATVAAAETSLR